MSEALRRAQADRVRALAAEAVTQSARLMTVLRVDPTGASNGERLVVLDWVGDGSVGVEARANPDVALSVGNEVLVVMVGRSPFVVCRSGGAPPPPTV